MNGLMYATKELIYRKILLSFAINFFISEFKLVYSYTKFNCVLLKVTFLQANFVQTSHTLFFMNPTQFYDFKSLKIGSYMCERGLSKYSNVFNFRFLETNTSCVLSWSGFSWSPTKVNIVLCFVAYWLTWFSPHLLCVNLIQWFLCALS